MQNQETLDASPTKDFFIHMLTRDVPLARAIIDLIDNSVDGASRTGGDYSSFWIRLELNRDRFRIADNCGGITVEIAQQYAFRFGRPSEVKSEPGSIGQFGVGMKRTVFKLGGEFLVRSRTANSSFVVHEVVDEWRYNDQWSFRFQELMRNAPPTADVGTTIEVTRLNEAVAEAFAQENFCTALIKDIEAAHAVAMRRGLKITVNGIPVSFHLPQFFSSGEIQPAHWSQSYDLGGPANVNVRVYAGVAERSFSDGGWYVFCNGRMVIKADQSSVTGWGTSGVPQYHADFAFFRGVVFFDSDAPGLLPWTTTKTGVDTDSPIYMAVRLEMLKIMRPVLDFLRRLADERSARVTETADESPLQEALDRADTVSHSAITEVRSFAATTASRQQVRTPATTRRIQYDKKAKDIDRVMKELGVRTLKEVGERTFDYFVEMEC